MKKRAAVENTLHALLVLVLSLGLIRIVWYAIALVITDIYPPPPRPASPDDGKPTPQDIAESLNTIWLSFDFDHCRNVCLVSRVACKLKGCIGVPGTKNWD
ncbi:hypothetical protein P280DRAFT_473951 [Massarina eburnea CBS 473.64]|uniref:Uncharacterized protein n=1 Tax=Massarina eburnea CBS 473.64 TaxID=1395130 RepID=A0A6A6RL71_9PLEO|nr:hypothetical protein P280DRAFT_473951 [Massarina eburnea CBS 473.64]